MRARTQGGFETYKAIYLAPFFTDEKHTNNILSHTGARYRVNFSF